jgi:hypothetical protein
MLGISTFVVLVSPSLRSSIASNFEVRDLVRFRVRFSPDRVGTSCPNSPLNRIAACARTIIIEENRLQHASMTARIYYLATIAEVAAASDEFARNRSEKVEARSDLLEYLNDEMKAVLVQTGGSVDLSALDGKPSAPNSGESPEEALARRYHANLVDLWIKNWRKDEKYLAANPVVSTDPDLNRRLGILRADRDELFSLLSIDLTRYEKRRAPAGIAAPVQPVPKHTATLTVSHGAADAPVPEAERPFYGTPAAQ